MHSAIIIEGDEESSSKDIENVIKKYKKELANIELIICLDSACKNYE